MMSPLMQQVCAHAVVSWSGACLCIAAPALGGDNNHCLHKQMISEPIVIHAARAPSGLINRPTVTFIHGIGVHCVIPTGRWGV